MKLLKKDIKPFVRKALINVWIGMNYNDVFIKTRDCRLFYVMSGKGGIEIDGVKYKEAQRILLGAFRNDG